MDYSRFNKPFCEYKTTVCTLLLLFAMLSFQVAQAQFGITGAIALNRGQRATNNAEKKVTITLMSRGARLMMVSNNGSFIGAKWEAYQPSKTSWRLAGEDGIKTVYAQFQDANGNISETVSADIQLDRMPPQNVGVIINDGREYTNRKDRLVRLRLEADEAFQMRISNRYDFLGSPWISYRKKMPTWRLTPRTAAKTVYVQFKDRAGNVSEVATSKIILDFIPPTQCALNIENGAIYTKSKLVSIKMKAQGASEMIFKAGSGWEPYKETITWELSGGDGEKEVAAKFRDPAFNSSIVVKDRIILDTQPPQNLQMIINNGDKYVADPTNLNIQVFATGASEMIVSNDENFAEEQWRPFSRHINSWAVSRDNGKKTIYLKFRDRAVNESEVVSSNILLDDNPPKAGKVKVIAEGIKYDELRKSHVINNKNHIVDLEIEAESADYMMISNSNSFYGSEWARFKKINKNWELEGENDGERFIYMKFRDKAGNVSDAVSTKVIVDTQPPVDVKVFVKSGTAEYENIYATDSAKIVELRLFARGARFMAISNTNDFSNSSWIPYEEVKKWGLSGEDGEKTVYVKYKDFIGNESESVSDGIILDRKAPTNGSIILNKGADATNNLNGIVLASIKAVDAVKMQVSNTADYNSARWLGYSELNFDWPLAGSDGMKTVYVRFKDRAGNISETYLDSIRLDRQPPIKGTVEIDGGARITNNSNKKVKLLLHAEGVKEMRISNNYRFDDSQWEAYSEIKEWALSGPDGLKTVFVQFRDELGNISRVAQDRIGIDRQAPMGGSLTLARGKKFTTNIDKEIEINMRVQEATEMMISNNADFSGVEWKPFNQYIQRWTLDGDDGEKTVYVKFKDQAGNETEPISQSITLDRQQPINGSLVINEGAAYTNDPSLSVKIAIKVEGATEMIIAHDKFFRPPAKWVPYKEGVRNWNLKGGQGMRSVALKFRDEAGNESIPSITQILVDTEAPVPRGLSINNKKNSTDNPKFMMISEDTRFNGAVWEEFSEKKSWRLSAGPGSKRLFIKFKDASENTSTHIYTDIILLGEE
jgi:hypothetical protein